jgi:hypothetical protein
MAKAARLRVVAAVVVLVVSIGGTTAQPQSGETAAQPKKILLLHTFGPNFEQGAAWSREIQRELNKQSPWPLNIQEQSLVTALDGDDAADAKFVEYLKALYAQRPPDLIVALGAPAARFVQRHRQTCIRQRRCCLRQSRCAGLSNPCCPSRTPWLGCDTIKSAFRKHSAAVAGDEDHRDHHRKLPGERFWVASTNG